MGIWFFTLTYWLTDCDNANESNRWGGGGYSLCVFNDEEL